jgi:hypothetical protein
MEMPESGGLTPLVDCHAHVYPPELARKALGFREQRKILEGESRYDGDTALDGTPEGYVAWLEREGFAFGVVLPLAMKPHQVHKLNDFTERVTKRFPRLLPFGAIHPDLDDLKATLEDLKARGFLGVKIHPFFQKGATMSPFFEPSWLRLFEACRDLGLVVLTCTVFHDEIVQKSTRAANDLARLPKVFSGLKIIAAHLGAIYNWGAIHEELLGSDVYLDLSYALGFLSDEEVLEIILKHGNEKVLFGTDTPYGSAERNLERFLRLPISSQERANIGGLNTLTLLGKQEGLR